MPKKIKIKNKYSKFINDKMWRSFFIAWNLRSFAFGLMAVFTPIYFYANGYGLNFIFIVLAISALFNGLMRLPYAYLLSKRKNIKPPFAISIVLQAMVYVAYALLIDSKTALYFIAALDGILQCTLWSSYHYIFSASQHHKNVGSQIGLMYNGGFLTAIIAIVVGGIVGQKFGLVYNFFIASAVLLIAVIQVLKTKISWPHNNHNFKKHKINYKYVFKDAVAGTANIVDANVVAIIWPLLFIVFGLLNYAQVGLVIATGMALTIIANIFYGKYANDIDYAKKQLDIGIMSTMFIYFIRITAIASAVGAVFINILGQVIRGSVDVSFSVLFYRRLKHANSKIRYIAEYESITGYGLAMFYTVLWLIHLLGGSDKLTLIWAFLIAALTIPLARLIGSKN